MRYARVGFGGPFSNSKKLGGSLILLSGKKRALYLRELVERISSLIFRSTIML
ncbi:MAG: hypothetical protein RSB04_11320 [Gordonibacter sp.]|uniref:hypothetical protein n=1 Tax=Gordonibacter sp. TaxID=1968902 RepID=UPI002FC70FA7